MGDLTKKEIKRKILELKIIKAKLPLLVFYPELLESELNKLTPKKNTR